MEPREKGWLKNYLDFRKEPLGDLISEAGQKTSHPEQLLYRIIQPTGLMYGVSASKLAIAGFDSWQEKDRLKVLLVESLISSSLLYYDKPLKSTNELSDIIVKTLETIGNFYNNIFPEIAIPSTNLFGRKKPPYDVAERILDKRVDHAISFNENFWTAFFHNSLLFLDVFIFGQWIHTNADRIVSDFLRYEREELRFSVLKIIAAASHANKEVAYEERKFFDFFLQSTELSSEKKKEAEKILEDGIAIEDIDLPSENSWILKKFFLEISILTLWADKKLEQTELDFLKRLTHYFDFSDDDLENSMVAIEGFILEHWEQLNFLQDKKDYQQVGDQFVKRISKIAEKNQEQLIQLMQNNEEVLSLVRKANNNNLSPEVEEELHDKLIQLLKTTPAFGIVPLPSNFLSLPVLIKILPKNLFVEGA